MEQSLVVKIKKELDRCIEPEKREFYPKFFQAFPGGYGEGDKFLGVRVPFQRKIAQKYYRQISFEEIETLLQDPYHERRSTGLFLLINKYEKAKTDSEKNTAVEVYLRNIDGVNNWDLVDVTAPKILGAHLMDRDRTVLYELANSQSLWKQRIAVLTTFYFIKNGDYSCTLELAEKFLEHEHDLMHKAVGWMLREIGKRDYNTEYQFLTKHYRKMPRTMLRYAIEHFEEPIRQAFLKGEI